MTVVDSGIWVSAIKFGGLPRQAINHLVAVDQIAVSDFIEAEVLRILSKSFNIQADDIEKTIRALWDGAHRIVITNDVKGVYRDPKDDHVLECARKASASLILTGDKDLLDLGDFEGIPIMNARTYLQRNTIQ